MNIFKILTALVLTFALGACDTGNDDAKYLGYWKQIKYAHNILIITHESGNNYIATDTDLAINNHPTNKNVVVMKDGDLVLTTPFGVSPLVIKKDGALLYAGTEYTRLTEPEITEAKKVLESK